MGDMVMRADRDQIKEVINRIWKLKQWNRDAEKMSEWANYLLKTIKPEYEVLVKAGEEFATDPLSREIGHLFGKINGVVSRDKMEEPIDLSKYRHKGRGPNLAPDIMEIIDMDPPEKWQKMIDLSKRMINEGPESAKTEWHKTLRYAEGEMSEC